MPDELQDELAKTPELAPQKETTTEKERVASTAALVAAENATAPSQEDVDVLNTFSRDVPSAELEEE